jgi:hypothetical protein
MIKFAIMLLFLALTSSAMAQDRERVYISLGYINGMAKALPMPQFADVSRLKGLRDITVRVKIDLQKGEVIEGKVISQGDPLVNSEALRAAKEAKFVPVLPEFPDVRGDGLITYTRENFNKPTVLHKKPRSFLIITRGVLNDRAKTRAKPKAVRSGKEFLTGWVEVAILVLATGSDVLAAHAVLGPEELHEVSEKAAMKVKFPVAHIDGDGSQVYVKGIIVYTFRKDGKVE